METRNRRFPTTKINTWLSKLNRASNLNDSSVRDMPRSALSTCFIRFILARVDCSIASRFTLSIQIFPQISFLMRKVVDGDTLTCVAQKLIDCAQKESVFCQKCDNTLSCSPKSVISERTLLFVFVLTTRSHLGMARRFSLDFPIFTTTDDRKMESITITVVKQ